MIYFTARRVTLHPVGTASAATPRVPLSPASPRSSSPTGSPSAACCRRSRGTTPTWANVGQRGARGASKGVARTPPHQQGADAELHLLASWFSGISISWTRYAEPERAPLGGVTGWDISGILPAQEPAFLGSRVLRSVGRPSTPGIDRFASMWIRGGARRAAKACLFAGALALSPAGGQGAE